jgi:hypothetical protein
MVTGRASRKPLGDITTAGLQAGEDIVGFYALGNDPEGQVVAEIDDRADDGRVGRVGQHVGDEALVDLELVERQLGQVAELGLAPAEVVQACSHSRSGQFGEDRRGALGIAEQGGPGDLDDQPVGANVEPVEDFGDMMSEIGPAEAASGHVDGDGQVGPGGSEVADFGQCGGQHPGGEFVDQVGLLRQEDETVGIDEPVGGVLRSNEGLDRLDTPVC